MKKTLLALLTLVFLFLACQEDEDDNQYKLTQTGLIGNWEIQTYEVNGIMDMSIRCCDFLMFSDDDDSNDFSGEYLNYGSGFESSGYFDVNVETNTLTIDNGQNFVYQVNDNILTLSYTEDGNNIIETRIKVE